MKYLSKIPMLMLALMAAAISFAAFAHGAPTPADTAMIDLCVEWTKGFTGHADTISMALASATAASTKLKTKTRTSEGEDGADDILNDDDALDMLVDRMLERMQVTKPAPEPKPDPAADEPDAETRMRGGDAINTETDLDLDEAGVAVRIGQIYAQPWEVRCVKMFNSLAFAENGDRFESRKLAREVIQEQVNMDGRMRRAEFRAAKEVLRDAGYKGASLTRAMSSLTGAAGGFAIPTPLAAELFVIIEQGSVARENSRMFTLTAKSIQLSSVATKPVATWTAEKADFTESDMALSQETWTPYKLTSITSWTTELDEDQAIALLPFRIELLGEAFAEKEDIAFFQGDGTTTYGNVTGLLNLASANGVTMSAGDTTHAALTFAYLRSVRDAVPYRRRRGAAYFMHSDTLSFLEGIAHSNAAPEHAAITRGPNGEILRIWQHPIVLSDDMPATAAAGEPFVAFGNPSRYTLRGQRAGFEVSTYDQAVLHDGTGNVVFNAVQNDGMILAVRQRVGYRTPVGVQSAFAVLTTAAS